MLSSVEVDKRLERARWETQAEAHLRIIKLHRTAAMWRSGFRMIGSVVLTAGAPRRHYRSR